MRLISNLDNEMWDICCSLDEMSSSINLTRRSISAHLLKAKRRRNSWRRRTDSVWRHTVVPCGLASWSRSGFTERATAQLTAPRPALPLHRGDWLGSTYSRSCYRLTCAIGPDLQTHAEVAGTCWWSHALWMQERVRVWVDPYHFLKNYISYSYTTC